MVAKAKIHVTLTSTRLTAYFLLLCRPHPLKLKYILFRVVQKILKSIIDSQPNIEVLSLFAATIIKFGVGKWLEYVY